MNTAKIASIAARLSGWAERRAAERSTWVGLALVATAFGKSVLADHLTSLGYAVPMILGAGGVGLMAASTSRGAPSGQPQPTETASTSD